MILGNTEVRGRALLGLLLGCLSCGPLEVDFRGDDADTTFPDDTGETSVPGEPWAIVGEEAQAGVGGAGLALVTDLGGDRGEGLAIAGGGSVALHARPEAGSEVAFSEAEAVMMGEVGSDFGAALAWDGSGPGLAIGASLQEEDGGWESNAAGAAWIFAVADLSGTVTAAEGATTWMQGQIEGGELGAALDIGDVDGDGLGDLVVGAPGEWYGAGRVYALLGTDGSGEIAATDASWYVRGLYPDDGVGSAVAAGPDLTGDGYGDLVACGPGYDGKYGQGGVCYLFAGEAGLETQDGDGAFIAAATVAGIEAEDGLGSGSQTVDLGDVDGDGEVDLVIGAPGYAGGGAIAVFFGGNLASTQDLSSADCLIIGSEGLGASLKVVADREGDGAADLLVGWQAGGQVDRIAGVQAGERSIDGLSAQRWTGEAGEGFGLVLGGLWAADKGQPWLVVGAPDFGEDGQGRVIGQR